MSSCSRTLLSGLLAASLLLAGCAGPEPVHSEAFVMNTFLIQTIYGTEEDAASDETLVRDLEAKLSRTQAGSEIRRLEAAQGTEIQLSEDTAAVLTAALAMQEQTGGAYSPFLGELRDLWGFGSDTPAVPDAGALQEALERSQSAELSLAGSTAAAAGADIDLGGIAKGYALDCINANLASRNVSSALINFGGALLARGQKPDGPWLIGVRDPLAHEGSSIAEFEAQDICIETSGISEQSFEQDGVLYHHLLDPKTGRPAENELASVTVAASSGTEADVYATALFVMGLDTGLAFADENGIRALFITRDRTVCCSEAFDYDLVITDSAFHAA